MGGGGSAVVARAESEVADEVLRARETGGRLRATGSGGSKNEVTAVPGTALRLEQDDEALVVGEGTVSVPASWTTARMQDELRRRGLILPTVGEWRNATVGGSLATGTHGGSAHHGIMSASVRAVRVVTGTGELLDVTPGDEAFGPLALSLGALGVVTRVTFPAVPRFSLRMETDVVPLEAYLEDPVAQEARAEFHASVWIPSARRVIRFAADRAPDPSRAESRRARFGRWTAFATFLARRLGLHHLVSSRLLGWSAVADGADILSPLDVPPRLARFRNRLNGARGRNAAELAVPARAAREVIGDLDAFFRDHGKPLNNPIGLRMSPADDLPLSPCQGRDTLWLDIFYDHDEAFEAGLRELADTVGGGKRYDVRVRVRDAQRDEPSDVGRLTVRTPDGRIVSLDNVVRIEESTALTAIQRTDQERSVTIFANLRDDLPLGDALPQALAVANGIAPPGYAVGVTGQSEQFGDAFGDLLFALLLATAIIYIVLAIQFEHFVHPVTLMMALPLAVSGALGLMVITGTRLGILGMIGMILLMGLVMKNSILLIDLTNQLRARGMGMYEALREACPRRLRPILMTSASVIFGVLPVALQISPGSEMRAPMAIAVIGGIFSSTLLTLLIIPVVYTYLDRLPALTREGVRRLGRLFGGGLSEESAVADGVGSAAD